MRFTVVIPAYDCESYVGEAVRSALAQSVADLEVIVVDDGSTDATLTRARAIEDARLRVLTQPNSGVMAARRRGFEAGSGEAIVFLDSDDRLRPDALERYARALAAQPGVGVVYGDRVLMDSEGRLFGSEHGALFNPRPSGDVLRRMLARNFLSTLGQVCFRRECLAGSTAIGLDIRRAIDWVLYCEVAASFAFAYLGPGPVVEYRLSADSMARGLANTGGHAADIDDIAPAIRAIYSIPAVVARFSTAELARLRRATEASVYAWKGQELLRARRWRAARACFFQAIRRSGVDARDLLCLALTYVRAFPPGAKRYIGVPEARSPSMPAKRSDQRGARRFGVPLPEYHRRAPIWARVALSVASLGAGAVGLELGARLLFPSAMDSVVPAGMLRIDEDLGWRLEPDREIRHKTRHFDVTYRINRGGYRDLACAAAKPAGVYRVLLFGDSQVFGWGIPQGQRYADLIEQRLSGVEICDLAVPGWGLDQQILLHEREGSRLEADEAVFVVTRAILYRDNFSSQYGKPKPMFRVVDGELTLVPPVAAARTSLFYHTLGGLHLPHLVQNGVRTAGRVLEGKTVADVKREWEAVAFPGGTIGETAKRMLARATGVAAARGVRVGVAARIPAEARDDLRSFCLAHGLGFASIGDGISDEDFTFGPDDPHWKRAVQARIADEIIEHMPRWRRGATLPPHERPLTNLPRS